MVQAQAQPSPQRPPLWQGPVLVGLCFGLGYGLTQRLLVLGWPKVGTLGQSFEVRSFPGTGLQSLRLRFGAEGQSIRGDLQRQQLEQQSRQAEQERQRQEQRLEAERRQEEQRLRRLEDLPLESDLEVGRSAAGLRDSERGPSPAAPAPARVPSRAGGLVEPPPPPVLPPPPASP
jgi:hypothetical protein